MVKIPGLGDLKKMGSDLIDSAKTVNLSGMVDKFKSGSSVNIAPGDDPLKNLVQEVSATLNALVEAQATEAALVKKMQAQLAEIVRVASVYQKPAAPVVPPVSKEDENK
jgi:hypothetical protein